MREKEFKAVFDGEKYVMPQDMSYRVKNRISEKTMPKSKIPFFKRSASAMLSIILASVLVITAAAVGGVMLFKSIYGDNIEPIMPYSEQINLTAADQNYELTLHEAVADEYTTAYIFSIKRLTVGASGAGENETSMIFGGFWQNNDSVDRYLEKYNPQDNPEIFIGYNGYDKFHTQIFYAERNAKDDVCIVLIRQNVAYNAENGARYLIRQIDNLKTSDTDYYAIYVISGEDQVLSIGVGKENGPELTLPKMTKKAPSVTRSVQEYYRQYLKQNHPTMIFSNSQLSDLITITPLAVYIKNTEGYQYNHYLGNQRNYNIGYINSAFYSTAELVFDDGTEKSLSQMSQNEMGITLSVTTGVYLFDEVLDTSLIKSFMVYDTVEFPMDATLPVIDRETGTEIVVKYEAIDLMLDRSSEIVSYLDGMYPEERKEGKTYCGNPGYRSENSCKIIGHDCEIIMSVYDITQGETLAAAADRLLQEYPVKYNWAILNSTVKDGTCSLGNVRYADITASILGGETYHTHYFFFETGGKLVVMQLTENTNAWPYYSLDALLQLITFN